LQQSCQNLQMFFFEKTTLPPHRESDHHIPLKEGAKPPNVRPYRVPHKKKDEVEKLIKTMLEQSTIRPSNIPYASPTILVRKRIVLGGCA
jgi:hypothetical protein